jgi:hypothetical protein
VQHVEQVAQGIDVRRQSNGPFASLGRLAL